MKLPPRMPTAGYLLSLYALLLVLVAPVQAVIDIGTTKQLFIDEQFIASSSGMALTVNQPQKMEAVLETDQPWDAGRIIYPSVVPDPDGGYRMYYYASAAGTDGSLGAASFAMAYSPDGLTWEKPNLGVVNYGGSTDNNLIPASIGHVFFDSQAPADERYKLLHGHYNWNDPDTGGVWVGHSADGIHWDYTGRQSPYAADSHNVAFYDSRIDKYVAYVRAWDRSPRARTVARIEMDDILAPWPVPPTSPDSFWIWGTDHPPVLDDEMPVVLAADALDPPDTDIYTPAVEVYPFADDIYFSFFSLYQHDVDGPIGNDGWLDVHLAVSRDGQSFTRPDRQPYIPMGVEGEDFDWGGIYYVPGGMIRQGDQITQYYVGFNTTHHGFMAMDEVRDLSKVFRVVQRFDGFVSADFGTAGGTLLTPTLEIDGTTLVLNVACSEGGFGRAELRDEDGQPIEGFTLEDCDFIAVDDTEFRVTWNGSVSVATAPQRVKLFFEFSDAKLYSFQFILQGDLNGDGVADAADIDFLFANPRDINGDGQVDALDLQAFVNGILGRNMGDTNLDGHVDEADLAWIAAGWKQGTGYTWATGDLTGDGYINAADLAYLANNWKQTSLNVVPEPASLCLLIGAGAAVRRSR